MVGTNWKGIGMAQRRWINLSIDRAPSRDRRRKNAAFRHAQRHHVDAWTHPVFAVRVLSFVRV